MTTWDELEQVLTEANDAVVALDVAIGKALPGLQCPALPVRKFPYAGSPTKEAYLQGWNDAVEAMNKALGGPSC